LNFHETLTYLYAALPVFHRIGPAAYKNDLGNTIALMQALNHPERALPSIHIAGTNGKGSVSSMLSAIFTHAGYKTGLYTSPHLQSFTERIRINGKGIPEEEVAAWVGKMKPLIESIQPSFFEITVAMCFDYFRQEGVEIAIIETGLGGRLDSTNVVQPELSIITNISFDHMDLLGDTLEKIASEKAGIIKPGVPCVIGTKHPGVLPVFQAKAVEVASPIYQVADLWLPIDGTCAWPISTWNWQNKVTKHQLTVQTDLSGQYQQENIGTVLAACSVLNNIGFPIAEETICQALSQVTTLSGLKGRMQKLGDHPFVLTDVGHNEGGIQQVISQILSLDFDVLHIVLGMVSDKDRQKILTLLPTHAHYYFVHPDLPRALPAHQLKNEALAFGLQGNTYISIAAGIKAALAAADSKDLVFIGGSTFVVAEALDFFDALQNT
jgi:dihydrofolate synthase/folylpolyglutamate synthase